MNTFEYVTVLVSIVVGLAVADMATSLHRLLRNRSRVRWTWVPLAAALLIFLEILNFWWQWDRFTGHTWGELFPYFFVLVLIFLAASASLPDEVSPDGLDLGAYFDDVRPYFWAVYGCYAGALTLLLTFQEFSRGASIGLLWQTHGASYFSAAVYLALIFVPWRWASGLAILATLGWALLVWDWASMPLPGKP